MKICLLFVLLAFVADSKLAAQTLSHDELVQVSEDELLRIGGPGVGPSIRASTGFTPSVTSLDSGNREVKLYCGCVYAVVNPVVEFNQHDQVVSIQVASRLPLYQRLEAESEIASVSVSDIRDGYSNVYVVVNTPGWNAELFLNDGTEQLASCWLRPFTERIPGIGPTDNLSVFAIQLQNDRLSDSRVVLSPPIKEDQEESTTRIFVVPSDFVDDK